MNRKNIKIGNKSLGPGSPVFIIAEAGVNHNGDLELAKQLVDAAVAAGADAVKFQTFTAELLVTGTAEQAEYQTRNIGKTESQFDMLKRLELKYEYHSILMDYCQQKGIIFLSTPFAEANADFLETLNMAAYKIPSGEINNIPFLRHVAKKGKPMIVASGMADLEETIAAVKTVQAEGNKELIILHSTSNYPPSSGSLNLRVITTLQQKLASYGVPVGYSDNGSPGITADIIAAALGSCVIEKHFTLDKAMEGPDHKASLNPTELAAMIKAIRETEVMLGSPEKKCTPEEVAIKAIARKSVISKNAIAAGSEISLNDIIMKRPGNGIPPTEIDRVVGKKAARNIPADTLIEINDLV
jgi:N,N'-diacetyllegionaminate synthase